MTETPGLPEAAPAFRAHFTDPLYDDESQELAPFGSDEGWDMLHHWAGRRFALTDSSTVEDLLVESGFGWVLPELGGPAPEGEIPEPAGQVDAATLTIGAGFTLLRLTGRIDDAGRELTLRALGVLDSFYGAPPTIERQRADLLSWAARPA